MEAAQNDRTRLPGLHGVIDDPNIPEEDEILDIALKPRFHFYYQRRWENCIDGVKREAQSGKRPWERGYTTPIEANKNYMDQLRIKKARESALKERCA